jgi:hypothetical protein
MVIQFSLVSLESSALKAIVVEKEERETRTRRERGFNEEGNNIYTRQIT